MSKIMSDEEKAIRELWKKQFVVVGRNDFTGTRRFGEWAGKYNTSGPAERTNPTIRHDTAQFDAELKVTEDARDVYLLHCASMICNELSTLPGADIGDMFALAAQEARKRKITPGDLRRIAFLLADKADEAAVELGCECDEKHEGSCVDALRAQVTELRTALDEVGETYAPRLPSAIPKVQITERFGLTSRTTAVHPYRVGPIASHWQGRVSEPVYQAPHGEIRYPAHRPKIGDTFIGHVETVDISTGILHVRSLP